LLATAPVTATIPNPKTKEPLKVTVSRFDVQLAVAGTLGNLQAIQRLPATIYDMSKGDFTWAAAFVVRFYGRSIGSAMGEQTDCTSGVSRERLARIRKEASETLIGDTMDLPLPDACDAWVPNDLGQAFRSPLRSDVPTLLISGDIDGHTPTSNAEAVARGFTHQHLIEVGNAAHGAYTNDPKVLDAVAEFLKTGTMPSFTKSALPALVFDTPATLKTPTS
jgi:pimeloyl-ACP methyl ester carboxylesterase